jgi:hypothetical protein
MNPINPLIEYRNRIDILKRVNSHPDAPQRRLDRKVYDVKTTGQIVRIIPKILSKYAARKNTKRARKANLLTTPRG